MGHYLVVRVPRSGRVCCRVCCVNVYWLSAVNVTSAYKRDVYWLAVVMFTIRKPIIASFPSINPHVIFCNLHILDGFRVILVIFGHPRVPGVSLGTGRSD